MKEIILRDEQGVAVLNTIKRRIIFTLMMILTITASILSIVTIFWFPYWIFTGRNILKDIFDI
jgi:hypothetical protein